MGDSQGAMAGALGVFNDIYHPGAVRAREQLDGQNERVIPVPSPGDRLLEEGKIVIQLRSA